VCRHRSRSRDEGSKLAFPTREVQLVCGKKSWSKMFSPRIMSFSSALLTEAVLKGMENYWREKTMLGVYQQLNSVYMGRRALVCE